MASARASTPAQILARNRRESQAIAIRKGDSATLKMMEAAEVDLRRRLARIQSTPGMEGSFSEVQARAAIVQVEDVIAGITAKLGQILVSQTKLAATKGAEGSIDYLKRADRSHRGLGSQPLAIREASMIDKAVQGVNSSLLRRIAASPSSTTVPMLAGEEAAGHGILARYGTETIGQFEEVIQKALLTRKPWAEVRDELTNKSPFLQQSPKYWAERIVRTETMGAYNRAGFETVREANKALGDMVKILVATFDNRTAADSYAVHGQIRRPEEAFQTWQGFVQSPPARPNDREIVVPHRISWPIPESLAWRTDAEVAARWAEGGRRGSPPSRPKMTTVDLSLFGKD